MIYWCWMNDTSLNQSDAKAIICSIIRRKQTNIGLTGYIPSMVIDIYGQQKQLDLFSDERQNFWSMEQLFLKRKMLCKVLNAWEKWVLQFHWKVPKGANSKHLYTNSEEDWLTFQVLQ